MVSEETKYKKMTETPVSTLILTLAVPTIISMMVTTIYNTADTFFVSKISVAASGATGIVFSLMAILQAFGFMLGHGAGSNISRLLGARKVANASVFLSTSFFLAIGTGFLIGLFGLLFLEPFLLLLGSTETILPEAKAYATFILLAAPAMVVSCVLNNVLRYEGIAVYAMIGLASGGILNMMLDPIFIFVLKLGTAGAGLATALSQYIGVIVLLLPFLRGKTSTKISFRSFTRSPADIGNIVLTGMPSMLRQGLNGLATTLLNIQASAYGDAAIAAFSIVNRCTGLLFSIALGIGQGFQPVSAFNFGAKKYSRVRKAFAFTVCSAMSVLTLLCLLCRFLRLPRAHYTPALSNRKHAFSEYREEGPRYVSRAAPKRRCFHSASADSAPLLWSHRAGTGPSRRLCCRRAALHPLCICFPPLTEGYGRHRSFKLKQPSPSRMRDQ